MKWHVALKATCTLRWLASGLLKASLGLERLCYLGRLLLIPRLSGWLLEPLALSSEVAREGAVLKRKSFKGKPEVMKDSKGRFYGYGKKRSKR
jgi:hypothetical protein